jgi:hypothetical protein
MAAHQLALLEADVAVPVWADERCRCARCADGRMYLVVASEPCACHATPCRCLAEGYARCDSCGALRQVFPREMSVAWHAATDAA